MNKSEMKCGVCGGVSFTSRHVLWDGLVNEWQLAPHEVSYVDRQQGEFCNGCGCNLRSIALANAIRAYVGTDTLFRELATMPRARELSILEINEAGMLSPMLRQFPHYVFGAYPEVDIHRLPYPDQRFDLVVHSDTLEHVVDPVHALTECRRVLKPGGALCFTVPVIVGRMSRNRAGLPKSCHGASTTTANDFVVQTEFGADAWGYVMQSGFAEVQIHAVEYPAALAFLAR